MRTTAIVIVIMVVNLYLTARFSSTIARMFGVSSMEGGDSYFTLFVVMPIVAVLSLVAGLVIAATIGNR